MTSEQIKQIIEQEQENIKLFEEKQQQFQELIDKAKLNIASAKSVAIDPKNPYERVGFGKNYFRIRTNGGAIDVTPATEQDYSLDFNAFENGLYLIDETFAEKTAKEIELKLKLKKFTYENGWSDEIWKDESKTKFYIQKHPNGKLQATGTCLFKTANVIYFSSEKIAERAIETFKDLLEEVL